MPNVLYSVVEKSFKYIAQLHNFTKHKSKSIFGTDWLTAVKICSGSTTVIPLRKKVPRLILIDGTPMVFRAFYSVKDMIHEGVSVNAVYGYTRMLLKIIREWRYDYIGMN